MSKKFYTLIKRICQYISFVAALPLILVSLKQLEIFGDFWFHFSATALALVPGKIGSYLRVAFYRGVSHQIDRDVNIGFGTFFTKRDIRIGRYVSIGAYCLIGSVDIGDHCQVASRVSIPSGKQQHTTRDVSENPAVPHFSRVVIGPHTWIGEAAVIVDDVGANCIVGAGSVVVHPVSDGQMVAGNPAKYIKKMP